MKQSTINGKTATAFDLLKLWQAITQNQKKLVYAKNGSAFCNFITD